MHIVRDSLAGVAVTATAWIAYRATDGTAAAIWFFVAFVAWVLTLAVAIAYLYEVRAAQPSKALMVERSLGARAARGPRCRVCRQRMRRMHALWMCLRCDFVDLPDGWESQADRPTLG